MVSIHSTFLLLFLTSAFLAIGLGLLLFLDLKILERAVVLFLKPWSQQTSRLRVPTFKITHRVIERIKLLRTTDSHGDIALSSLFEAYVKAIGSVENTSREKVTTALENLLGVIVRQASATIAGVTFKDRRKLSLTSPRVGERVGTSFFSQIHRAAGEIGNSCVDSEVDGAFPSEISALGVRYIIVHQNRDFGLLFGFSEKNPPTDKQMEFVCTAAEQLAHVIRAMRPWFKIVSEIDQVRTDSQDLKLGVAQISHDVRSALSCFSHGLDLLANKITLTTDAEAARLISLAKSNITSANSLLSSYLEIARVSPRSVQGFEPESSDVVKLAEEIVLMFALRAEAKGLTLALACNSPLHRVVCRAPDLRRILLNLVGNAVKFTDSGGVRVEISDHDDRSVRVVVIDTGIGVKGLSADSISVPYSRASTDREGVGLGLSAVSDLARRNGGHFSIGSGPAGGTKASVIFDKAEYKREHVISKEAENLDGPQLVDSGPKYRVLLVDDDASCSGSLARLIGSYGFEVVVADSVDTALAIGARFSVVLTDLDMPFGGGQRVIQELKRANPEIRIAVLSGTSDDMTAYRALGLGAEIIFPKPVEIAELVKWINTHQGEVAA